jgi:hypothetical protein
MPKAAPPRSTPLAASASGEQDGPQQSLQCCDKSDGYFGCRRGMPHWRSQPASFVGFSPRVWVACSRHPTLRSWGHSLFIPCSPRFGSGCRDRGDTADDDIAGARMLCRRRFAWNTCPSSSRPHALTDRPGVLIAPRPFRLWPDRRLSGGVKRKLCRSFSGGFP